MKPNQLSNTAAFIAVKFYGLTRDERFSTLFSNSTVRFYEQLVQHLPAPINYYYRGLKNKTIRKFFTFWEEQLLPGDLMHIILRKWYLSKWVKALRQSGYRQLLVLGAGFDHLATLNASQMMQCVELDAPRMAVIKRQFIETYDYGHPNLKINDAFFTHDSLYNILQHDTKLDANKKTIVIAEGFFDYFTRQHCAECLSAINHFFKDDIMLLSTLFALDELSAFHAFVYRNSIRLAREQLKLDLGYKAYLSLLESHSFVPTKVLSSTQMKQDMLDPRNINYPVLEGFYLIKARRKNVV